MRRPVFILATLVGALWSTFATAAVVQIEIQKREPYAEGRSMGDRGPYEKLTGRVRYAIDPKAKVNSQIVDVELAPRNAQGLVEFTGDIELWAPRDLSKASGTLLYDVNNRGNKTAPNMFNGGADEFLLRQGFIVMWSGWIHEVLPGNGRLQFTAPPALEEGKPLRGLTRADWVVSAAAKKANIAHRGILGSYRPASKPSTPPRLTRRLNADDPREEIYPDQWSFVVSDVESDGRSSQLPLVEVEIKGGVKPGYIYEVVYEAEGSVVQGTGMAGIRDLLSALRHDKSSTNPLRLSNGASAVKYVLGFGTSQSGRLLRQFLFDGFNADEQGRQVFDGMMPHVAGGGLGFFNHRFASPTRTNGQHEELLFPADYFPFTYGDSTDPFNGQVDGILRKCRETNTVPKVMHTQSSSEYWHRSGSLVHTDPRGEKDAEIPSDVRIYSFGGTQHGAGSGLPGEKGGAQLIGNPADYRPLLRGLIVALDAWVREGREPPKSMYPKLSTKTLVDFQESNSGWRRIPTVFYPKVMHLPPLVDRGPDWALRRITTIEPPKVLGRYGAKVPAYRADNNERGTLNLPAIDAPVASYTSWNMRGEQIGAPGELLGLQGAYIPLLKTPKQAQQAKDPRPALLDRYRDFADYQQRYLQVAQQLFQQRYVLEEELPRLKALSEQHRSLFE